MGVKTALSLQEVQNYFPDFAIQKIEATTEGIIDTTYIALGKKESYIVKKYERNIQNKILFDTTLLEYLHTKGLNVSRLLATAHPWYLYKKLKGTSPKTIKLYHLQLLGRFIAQLHQQTKVFKNQDSFIQRYPIKSYLQESKRSSFYYYKKLSSLTRYKQECDGFIHGDIFKDNTLFDDNKVAIFDFIDGGCGSFAFDLGVILLSFNPHKRRSYTMMLLKSYNQTAPKKIKLQELKKKIQIAAKLYALLRIHNHKKTQKAKELAKLW
jgi:homoserine kinase type II